MLCLNVHISLKCSISLLSWYHILLLSFSSNCYPSSMVARLKKKKAILGWPKRFIQLFPLPNFWPAQCTRTQFLLICWTKIVIKEGKKVKSLSCVQLFATPWTVAYQAPPPSIEFSRQEYWSVLHFLLQGIFLTQGSNPGLLHCRQTLYHLRHQGS